MFAERITEWMDELIKWSNNWVGGAPSRWPVPAVFLGK